MVVKLHSRNVKVIGGIKFVEIGVPVILRGVYGIRVLAVTVGLFVLDNHLVMLAVVVQVAVVGAPNPNA